MNLGKKKTLAAKTLNVGKERVLFVDSRLEEIKNAITRQDIKDLQKDGAIKILDKKGRRKIVGRKNRRMAGSIRKKVNKTKREYIAITRKLRGHVAGLKKHGKLTAEKAKEIRKKIRARTFKSKTQLKDYISGLEKTKIVKKKK